MAFVAEAIAKLRLDTSDFQRGLTRTTADVGRAGEDMGKKLKRAFGAGDVFKGLLMGVGIGSVQQVVDLLTDGWRKAAESAKEIADLTAQTAEIYSRMFSERRTPAQNLAENQKEQARLQRELDKTTAQTATRREWNPATQQFEDRTTVTREDDPTRRAEIAKRLAELAAEEQRIKKQIADEEKRHAEAGKKAMEDGVEAYNKLQERREKIAQDEQAFARERMSTEERLEALKRDQLAVSLLLQAGAIDELDARERMLAIEKQIAATMDEQARQRERAQREQEQAERERKRDEEERERNEKQRREAADRVEEAKRDYATTLRDRSGFTVADAAAGMAGNATDRARARQVLSLEARARRIRSMSDYRDASGRRVDSAAAADAMINRADQLRGRIGALTDAERNPMAAAAKGIKKSEEHLAEIEKSLKPKTIGDDADKNKGKGGSKAPKK